MVLTSTSPTAISGAGTTSFINGNLRRYTYSDATTGTYALPVGNGTASTDYKRADYIKNDAAGITYIDVAVAAIPETGNNTEAQLNPAIAAQDGTEITEIMEMAEWVITPNAAPSGGDYGINLYAANTGLSAADDGKFCVLKRDNSSTDYADWSTFEGTTTIPSPGAAGRVYNGGNGYATRTGFTGFSRFAIGRASTVLPISLKLLQCVCIADYNRINWITETESENSHFSIARSKDGVFFSDIANIAGAGNSNAENHYSFTDNENVDVKHAPVYYRLSQTDYDGTTTTVGVVTSACTEHHNVGKQIVLSVFPNPASKAVTLFLSGKIGGDVKVVITDNQGKVVLSNVTTDFIASGFITIPCDDWASGLYHVKLTGKTADYHQVFIKE